MENYGDADKTAGEEDEGQCGENRHNRFASLPPVHGHCVKYETTTTQPHGRSS
jgi:hypothetical protein